MAARLDGAVGVFDGPYQARVQLGRLVDSGSQVRIGAEAGLQGDPNYSSISAGLFASARLGHNFEGQLAGGLSDQEGRDARPYVSIGFSKLF